jgi:flagellar basal-body rod modification protein FlgD
MTSVASTTATNPFAALNPPAPATSSTDASGNGVLSQLDFLNLMMTQLQNQDPTQPMDASQMVSQMAQFGTVQGISNLNTAFSGLSSSLVSNQALQASSLLGHSVLVNGTNGILPQGGNLIGAVNLPNAAQNVQVTITDQNGATVATVPLGSQQAGIVNFAWDGTTNAGTTAPPGNYTISATSSVGNQAASVQTLISAPVLSVTINASGGGAPTLNVAGIGNIPLSSVVQIS